MVKPDQKSRKVASTLKTFYDSYGWKKDEVSGLLNGELLHEDLNHTVQKYGEVSELRYLRSLGENGAYFLDVGCGAKPRSKLAQNFDTHLCVDVSIAGLTEARNRIGREGQYILADMADLPFKDNSCDAALVCHCLYHVDKDLQLPVLEEIYRVIKPKSKILVFYSSRYNLISAVHLAPKVLARLANVLLHPIGFDLSPVRPYFKRVKYRNGSAAVPIPALYSFPHNPKWLASQFKNADVTCLATVTPYDTAVLKKLRLINYVLPIIAYLEKRFPHAMVYIGKYTCISIQKTD